MVNARRRQVDDVVAQLSSGSDDESDNPSDDEDEDGEFLAHLPPYVIPRVEKLRKLNHSRDQIMENYLAERAALEKKFESLLKPLYEERAEIVKGDKDDEIAKEAASLEETEIENATDPNQPLVKGIPQFWATALARTDAVGELITEDDVDCLEHLLDIKCIDSEDGKGFTLEFHFALNDYFTNTVITKEYVVPNLLLSDEPMLKSVKGTKIEWKSNRCLTHRTVKKKQRGKGKNKGQVRTVEQTEEKESFFQWFSPPDMPKVETLDEEEADRLEEIFDSDYEVAQVIRNQVIPKAVLWFTNQAEDDEVEEAIETAFG